MEWGWFVFWMFMGMWVLFRIDAAIASANYRINNLQDKLDDAEEKLQKQGERLDRLELER